VLATDVANLVVSVADGAGLVVGVVHFGAKIDVLCLSSKK